MTGLFREKDNLEPVTSKNRSRANFYDFLLFVILLILIVNSAIPGSVLRLLVLGGYLFVFVPFCFVLGGTPGQLLSNLRVRSYEDYEKGISIRDAYSRLKMVILVNWLGIIPVWTKKRNSLEEESKTITVQVKENIKDEEIEKHLKRKAKINFGIAITIYIAWVIWLGNYWFMLGCPIVFDIYISKKVNWSPWKKRGVKNKWWIEWLDALIFAVVAVTLINIFLFQNYKIPTASMENSLLIGDHLFVSKLAYGPRIPNTPISFPFSQNTMPLSHSKSYVEWIQLPYKRLAGLQKIKRNDVVVFNCPALDTVNKDNPTYSLNSELWAKAEEYRRTDQSSGEEPKPDKYYLNLAMDYMKMNHEIIPRPVDRRDNYIKRCVGMPGDTLMVWETMLYINGEPEENRDRLLHKYHVKTNGNTINRKVLERLNIAPNHYVAIRDIPGYEMHLSLEQVAKLKALRVVDTIIPQIGIPFAYFNQTYPNDPRFTWSPDNFGPVYIPKKGNKIPLTINNLPIYSRAIRAYEGNTLQVINDSIYINGELATSYTFKMNYYFMMGDNRHTSWDSRSWGFVPEDHIVGKPKFIWLSVDKNKTFLSKIRWNRFFKKIE